MPSIYTVITGSPFIRGDEYNIASVHRSLAAALRSYRSAARHGTFEVELRCDDPTQGMSDIRAMYEARPHGDRSEFLRELYIRFHDAVYASYRA